MPLAPHTMKPSKGAQGTSKRVGRGNGSGKGTYAGRGLKGQRSRSGGKSGTAYRGFKQLLSKIPKLRGFKSMRPKAHTVTLQMIDRVANDGDLVTPQYLDKKGVISDFSSGVKIVATGDLTKKITVKNCAVSKGAAQAIEKAGGTIQS